MTQPLPPRCPLCSGTLEVTEVSCRQCDSQIRGHFQPARFDRLDAEQLRFLETFLRCRGVLRDVEAALGISYPTVRARLDSLLSALSLAGETSSEPPSNPTADKNARRREILAAIDAGKLSADEGLQALQDL